MCEVLLLPGSTYYYEETERQAEDDVTLNIVRIFHKSRPFHGARKVKQGLRKIGRIVSRSRIGRVSW
ncbi:IS3 family transposase [Radiobacillus deserti]|uniref:HTH-like domain-containing protein n=1 Tax=Radiobacillus deserti TaxID=2594883 RepID=A0A516KDN4_9BACI|nr:IS3 family transposase [Radiobacillus deserti]QDP39477.1 hypothetical protein FN924_04375 [Radiobacillus deserti]